MTREAIGDLKSCTTGQVQKTGNNTSVDFRNSELTSEYLNQIWHFDTQVLSNRDAVPAKLSPCMRKAGEDRQTHWSGATDPESTARGLEQPVNALSSCEGGAEAWYICGVVLFGAARHKGGEDD